MKKIFILLMIAVATIYTGRAQYYYIKNSCSGENPGGLNTDIEQPPGVASTWITLLTTTVSPTWSATETLPFTFMFNGGAVTEYKVSSSGVLTFSKTNTSAPPHANVSLPSALVPDSSICVWGMQATGKNDQILYRTFGNSPNRQHWIQFNSFSEETLTTNGWTYWAIVLEETTNKIYIVDQRTYCGTSACAENVSLTLGIQVDTSNVFQVAGSPDVEALTTEEALDTPDDNVYYEFALGTRNTYDVAGINMTTFTLPYTSLTNAPFTISGTLMNKGTFTVTAMDINYSINGGTAVVSSLSDLTINPDDCYSYIHSTGWTPTVAGLYTIKVWASNINGNVDVDLTNDTITASVFMADNLAQRKVLIEEFSSSTCGPCAAANPAMNQLMEANGVNTPSGKVNAIKYQMNYPGAGNDPAYNPECGTRHNSFYGLNSIPTAIMDGNVFEGSPGGLDQTTIDDEYTIPSPFEIDLTATYDNYWMNVVGSVKCLADFSANSNLKLYVAVVENHITSADNGHGVQSNGETEWKEVMRKMLPNSSGTALSSQTPNATTSVDLTYSFSTTGSYKLFTSMAEISVIAFIQDDITKDVFQSFVVVPTVGIQELNSSISSFQIFPNPFKNNANVFFNLKQPEKVKVQIFNMMGQMAYEMDGGVLNKGEQSIMINNRNLSQGIYLVKLITGNNSAARKISVE